MPATLSDNGNNTVTDSRSGLEWQQTVVSSYTWLDAKAYCASLSLVGAGWRLPTKAELESIVDVSRYNPAIDPVAFPSAPSTAFWSSSPTVDTAGYGWIVVFNDGDSTVSGPLVPRDVRCVRSNTAVFASAGGGGAPPGRYTIVNGTVYDTHTKLTWQQVVDPSTYTQGVASDYCAGLDLAGRGWRLPRYSELLTIVDPTRSAPAIDGSAFPNTPPELFWSSSQYAGASTGVAWYVNFRAGDSSDNGSSVANHVRCVR
jgi:hypothetical protein